MPTIHGAFSAALSSPDTVKNASQDAYGNIKIPMIKSCVPTADNVTDNWHELSDAANCSYSSLTGIPVKGIDKGNYTFSIETSYMYTDCSVSHTSQRTTNTSTWLSYVKDPLHTASNGLTLGIHVKEFFITSTTLQPRNYCSLPLQQARPEQRL
jgi:hypothetical protein